MTALDTGTEDLRAEIDGGVAVITMNRPDRRNAFSYAMVSALEAVLAQVETDEAVGCVVLTGAGGAFCAGGDVKSMAAPSADRGDGAGRSPDALIHRQRLSQRATSGRLWSMPKPTIAAIGGPAAGAGLSLALACDLRYAVPGAVLTTAFAKVAFAGDYGGTWFLTRLVGSSKASGHPGTAAIEDCCVLGADDLMAVVDVPIGLRVVSVLRCSRGWRSPEVLSRAVRCGPMVIRIGRAGSPRRAAG